MSKESMNGQYVSLQRSARYLDDPLALFQSISNPGDNSLLLESAEIGSKAARNSLMLIDAALRIEANGPKVSFAPLTENGRCLMPMLTQLFSDHPSDTNADGHLTVTFPRPDETLDEDSRLKADSPVAALRRLMGAMQSSQPDVHDKALFLGGALAYDLIAGFEQLPEVPDGDNHCPDFVFYLAETLLLISHQEQSATLLGTCFCDSVSTQMQQRLDQLEQTFETFESSPTGTEERIDQPVQVDISDDEFCARVAEMKGYIRQGDIFQVVPSRTFSLPCPAPIAAYAKLKQTNPSPYMFYQNDQNFVLFGASPESALKFGADSRDVEVYPIAGTRRRGLNPDGSVNLDLDGRIELDLRMDKKETAEHLMLVDLARNDIARISEPGSRYVADLLNVDRYSHVMHLVSRVVGTLRSDLDALHAYQACMNMGTLVGAPKIRAAELIRQVEGKRRGSYGGAVGYISGNGDMDTCIVIRSAFVDGGVARVQAGAGVVYDSNPQAEADETRNKAAAVLNAIALAHGTSLAELNRQEA